MAGVVEAKRDMSVQDVRDSQSDTLPHEFPAGNELAVRLPKLMLGEAEKCCFYSVS